MKTWHICGGSSGGILYALAALYGIRRLRLQIPRVSVVNPEPAVRPISTQLADFPAVLCKRDRGTKTCYLLRKVGLISTFLVVLFLVTCFVSQVLYSRLDSVLLGGC